MKQKPTPPKLKADPRILKRVVPGTLTPNQERILAAIRKWPGITIKELEPATGFSHFTLEVQVHLFAERGLLQRKRITILGDLGSYHRAYALYVKGKIH